MRAARLFVLRLAHDGRLERTARVAVSLYGSLGATGKGHGSDKAVLLGLAGLAAPFTGQPEGGGAAELAAALPLPLWLALPALPVIAAAIGWVTAQSTVRRWLRRLP